MPKACEEVFSAIIVRDVESVRALLTATPSCLEQASDSGRTPLLEATALGYDEIVDELLRHKPQLEVTDEDGSTALILAAGFSLVWIITKLIQAGAAVDGANPQTGETPLMRAAGWGTVACLTTLLNKGAHPNAQNKYGGTALMNAAFNNQVDCARALLSSGASVDMIDKRGRTALYHAVSYRHFEVARLLRDNGADPGAKDLDGISPRVLVKDVDDSRWFLLFPEER